MFSLRLAVASMAVALAPLAHADLVRLSVGLPNGPAVFEFDDSYGATPAGTFAGSLVAPAYQFQGSAQLGITQFGDFTITQKQPTCGGIYPPCFLQGLGPLLHITSAFDPLAPNQLGAYLDDYLTKEHAIPNSGLTVGFNPGYLYGDPFSTQWVRATDYSVLVTETGNSVPEPSTLALIGLAVLAARRGNQRRQAE